MANSTDTFWSVSGVSLQTLGFNISTMGGHEPPPLRGGDTMIPYRVGQVLEEKVPDSRTLAFTMWAIGFNEDGQHGAFGPRVEYERNYKKIRSLIWNQGRPFELTKRWKDYGSNTVKSATAVAIYRGGLAPSMNGPARANIGFDLFLADPFFYGADEVINFGATATASITPTVLGDYPTTLVTVQFNGARNNMRLTNNTESHYVNLNYSVASGSFALLDVDQWTAQRSGTPVNLIKNVSHFGHKHWLSLRPGAQQLTVSSASGTGSTVLRYKPRWL